MTYLETLTTVGLGFLVYKRLMSEIADAPVKEGVKAKAGDMFGFGDLTAEEIRKAYIPQGEGTFSDIWKGTGPSTTVSWKDPKVLEAQGYTLQEGIWKPPYVAPLSGLFTNLETGYVFLPEDFELVGPSRVGITRPKGLD